MVGFKNNTGGLLLLSMPLLATFNAAAAHATIRPRENGVSGRERTSINADWRFKRFTSNPDSLSYDTLKPWILPSANDFISGDKYERPSGNAPGANVSYLLPDFEDSEWEQVTLPHDWAITGTFDAPGVGGNLGRLPINGVGWYRHTLSLDASVVGGGKSIYLDVDGAMAYAAVWLNGNLVGGWPFGYNSWRLDLTPYAKTGDNQLSIRLDNALDSSRWYPGAGIYRNVWLVTVNPVHIAQYGTRVITPAISSEAATVDMVVEVENTGNTSQIIQVTTEIFEFDGTTRKAVGNALAAFAPSIASVAGRATQAVNGSATITNPKLWGPPPTQHPNQYLAISTVSINGTIVDTYETPFGVRSITYDADRGLLINGEAVRVQGTCNHHDLGSLGAAWNDRAAERQQLMLQEMGSNALRTSHNPPAPEFLSIADRLGMMVMDELFDTWNFPKVENDFHRIFPEWHEADTRSFVRRDRNHPSIIAWSVGNEIPEQSNSTGTATIKTLQDLVHEEDSTRLVTVGMNSASPETGFADTVDIIGLNYQGEGYGTSWSSTFPNFHSKFPSKMIWTTESASTVSSRGIYLFPVTPDKTAIVGGGPGAGGDPNTSQVSAYDLYSPSWASSPDKVFEQQDRHSYVAGEFVWTGWDYLGEPTPYDNTSRSSYFGIIDLAGFKKDRFYLYQSRWKSQLPMAHLLPHWSFGEERIGQATPVHLFTSGDEAELFVNGESAGRKKKGQYDYRLRWDNVTYSPGSIRVVAYKDGKEWAFDEKKTAGIATGLTLTADRTSISGDRKDLSFITVAVTDVEGNTVPNATNEISFSITGPGTIVSTDNGDAADGTPFTSLRRKAFSGYALVIVRAEGNSQGELVIEAKADTLSVGTVKIKIG